jgi:hypothetical protein
MHHYHHLRYNTPMNTHKDKPHTDTTQHHSTTVTKASGEKEEYSREKLCHSLREAGADDKLVGEVCAVVEKTLTPNTSTRALFRTTARELRKRSIPLSARYSVRRSVNELGPAGFLFEQYVERLIRAEGYTTARNQIVAGECIEHEVDILAVRERADAPTEHIFIEAKYHNKQSLKSHVDVVMYADARLEDIRRAHEKTERGRERSERRHKLCDGHSGRCADVEHRMWVITNTKFTKSSIRYALCRNMRLIGWNYPRNKRHTSKQQSQQGRESLERLIEKHSLYPVTLLPAVTRTLRHTLAEHDLMLVQDIVHYAPDELAVILGIHPRIATRLIYEAEELMQEDS